MRPLSFEISVTTSRHNAEFKRLRLLVASPAQSNVVVLDGLKLLREALRAGLAVTEIVADPSSPAGREFLRDPQTACRTHAFSEDLISKLKGVETNPGLLAICERPADRRQETHSSGPVLILDSVQDPGNVGTLVRTAEAAGVSEVWLTPGSADPWSVKAIRASAGSVFRVRPNWAVSSSEALSRLRGRDQELLAMSSDPLVPSIYDVEIKKPVGVVLGSEGRGVSPEFLGSARLLRIPHSPAVESLNVAAAGAIALFEIARRSGAFK